MDETTSLTDSELLADSPTDLTQITDSNQARQFYNTTFISSSLNSEMEESFTAHDNLIIPNNMNQVPSTANQQVFRWTEEEKKTLQEYKIYYCEMLKTISAAETEGPQKLPKKPKRKLEQLLKEKSGKKKARKEITTQPESFTHH